MKYFLFYHVGSLNHGCEAIVRGTANIIRNSDSNAEIILSSNNPETDTNTGVDRIELFRSRPLTFFEKIIARISSKLFHSEKYAVLKMYSNIFEQAKDCDICMSVGGDTYCYGNNYRIQVVTEELKKRGKKIVLWGVSIGEEDLDDLKVKHLENFDAIYTREPLTYELLKNRLNNPNVFLNSDPAFCMERLAVEPVDGFTRDNTLGLNVSPLIAQGNEKINKITDEFIAHIIKNTTLNILLIPHVMQDGNNDYDYMKPFCDKYKNTGRIEILSPKLNAMQYKGYIANTRFFIGARTHATIAAYSSGVPTAVLGYSVKSRGISKYLFDEEKYVLDSKKIESSDELIAEFNHLVEDESEIRAKLKERMPQVLKSGMELGSQLMNL